MKAKVRVCELCNKEAYLYCKSDAAFLCFDCDSKVHNANFLVARHLRRLICSRCKSPAGKPFCGTRSPALRQLTCLSCLPEETFPGEDIDSISSSSSTLSSACISTAESQTFTKGNVKLASSSSLTEISSMKSNTPAASRRFSSEKLKKSVSIRSGAPSRLEAKTEGIFANWCKRLGLNGNFVVTKAIHALGMCLGRFGRVLPFRVSLAAAFWFGVRLCGDKSVATWQNLRRLEKESGVPAKLIVAVEVKVVHALRIRRSSGLDLEEGCAETETECSV